ncbi:MAG: formate dehydrogenase accessory sulfurtransferase FdhD, partial [Bacteroidota bacterium]
VQADFLVVEEPLEIRLGFEKDGVRHQKNISVTMRTPGEDEELALGFLFTEGIIAGILQVKNIAAAPVRQSEARENVVVVELAGELETSFKRLERNFYVTSSCGVCGKASIEAVRVQGSFELIENQPVVSPSLLHSLPERLLKSQSVFGSTGGLHAAALFDLSGNLLLAREDVGRHNALDKLIGAALRQGILPLSDFIVLVSGRAGFELVQKSVMAGVPILAAVGAPTSLSVQLAEEAGMTLVGFLRSGHFNVYTCPERVGFRNVIPKMSG